VYFMTSLKYFRALLIGSEVWKTIGYGTIVYLAAITSVDVEQYEAAQLDGANKLQQILHVTLPAISEIIAIMLILQMGKILGDNFEQIYTMYSEAVYEIVDVFDTYIYRTGIVGSNFSYTSAITLFKSVVSLILILLTNKAAKKLGSEGLF
ncbi:MAG TPA: sugar ABC transporter permease, partial [Candidatus Avoscillospira stercorigallinarum]|nr:sugar ABC transporter permease [Candidatus Avoscillospira stercorigallinarum]